MNKLLVDIDQALGIWRDMAEWKTHLNYAVRLLGSQNRLAEAMGCSQSKISWLLVSAEQIGAEDALAVHRATKGVVPASRLRPDLWPSEDHVPIEPSPATSPTEGATASEHERSGS
jgi:DNA-binding transcriptional regulator YdaS (Cro superfamily)